MADYLSRLESGEPAETTYDDLPDANLFHMSTTPDDKEDEWITEMTYFLSTGLPPEHLTLALDLSGIPLHTQNGQPFTCGLPFLL